MHGRDCTQLVNINNTVFVIDTKNQKMKVINIIDDRCNKKESLDVRGDHALENKVL
jgi:hypothetical protein